MADREQQREGPGDHREHLNDAVLSAYLDRASGLAPAARAAAEAHLAGCLACREALRDLETTVLLFRALPQVTPRRSFALTPEAAAAVGAPRGARPRFGWVWPVRWATAVVTILLLITIGLDLGWSAAAMPPTAEPRTNAARASATSSCREDSAAPQPGCVTAFTTGTVVILPTTAPIVAPAPASTTTTTRVNWRPAQLTLGVLMVLGVCGGFLLPPLLRRRSLHSV